MRQRCRVSTLSLAVLLLLSCFSSRVHAQATQIKPWFLLLLDTSGSMCEIDVNVSNSCGFPKYIKMNAAKCAIQKIVNSVGDADFGLEQFNQNQDCTGVTCQANSNSGFMRVAISATGAASILPLVDGVGAPTGDCDNTGGTVAAGNNTQELCSGGGTPLGGSLQKSREYFNGTYAAAGGMQAPTHADGSAIGCRPMSVILMTDGMENCTSSAPADAAALLSNTFVPTPTRATACTAAVANQCIAQPIKTYVIGFGISAPDTSIENIAIGGGTDNQIDGAGGQRGYYASDENSLSAALNQIILESQLTEVCNGKDDDCDNHTDEGYPKYCDLAGLRTNNNNQPNLSSYACPGGVCAPVPGKPGDPLCAAPEYASSSTCTNPQPNLLCVDPGEKCNVIDDDCDGKVDEGAPPLVGVTDGCDLKDNDCDGIVDEDCVPGSCTPEICDNINNDCDLATDEGLNRQCGTDVGQCVAGTQFCQAGKWGALNGGVFTENYCPDTVAIPETCNNVDDDCDGIVDHITRPCSPYGSTLECTAGVETCIGGVWQSTDLNNPAQCIGAKGPSTEICDGKNNDCNTSTADGSGDSRVGQVCGNDKGICDAGITVCTAGNVVCNDPNEAQTETCDGFDNDCDGKIDENTMANPLPGVGSSCFPGMMDPPSVVGECRLGTKQCIAGSLQCKDFKLPSAEICDNKDNDCNASTADGSADPALNQECGVSTGECDPGHNICTMGGIACSGGTGPVFEVCDGKDNDCDFKTDEDLPDDSPTNGMRDANLDCDVAGGLGEAGACEFGQRQCVKTGPTTYAISCIGGVGPTLETCDGFDNDCDGATDECSGDHSTQAWMDCTAGLVRGTPLGPLGAGGGKVCGTDVADCETGLTKCIADVHPGVGSNNEPGFICVGSVDGVPELCNNHDDDCDTKTDEELDPLNDPTLEQPCSDGVTIPACREPADANEPCGRCHFGRTACVLGAVACTGQVGSAPYESCNGTDDDCDGSVDECVDKSGANCGNVAEIDPETPVGEVCAAGQCQSGINQCVDGKLSCEGVISGNVETCNNLDDDCDGSIDEGFNKGAPCTENGEEAVGECRPGMIACDPGGSGTTVCINEIKPTTEVCNSLDDDCDRIVDEGLGLGDVCGSEVGLCEQGKLACVGGRQLCTGEVGPRPETCDCQDNDCDGKIDEDSADEPLCSVGACVMCQCALPCSPQMEFATRCPQGKAPVDDNGQCFCVGEQCKQSECAKETIKDGDEVRCAPDDTKTGTCVCQNNACTFRCAGVTCDGGRVCDPTDGKCKLATCLLQQFGCEDGKRCTMLDSAWTCVSDDCADTTCGAAEACRDGDCVPSCAHVSCSQGEKCVDGSCVKNQCAGVNCEAGLVCDPEDGSCVLAGACVAAGCGDGQLCDTVGGDCEEDPCLRTHCPRGEKCDSTTGQCAPLCGGKLLFCGEKCVDPTTSRDHCGATGDCLGGNTGETCAKGLVCSLGECSDSCADKLVNCGGECIDPKSDIAHCGASDDCKGGNAGALCRTGFSCQAGECASIGPGGSSGSGGKGGSKVPDGTRVIAAGGGGCACSVPGAASANATSSTRGLLASLLLALIATGLGRRRRRRSARSLAPALRGSAPALRGGAFRALFILAGWLLVVVLGSGCKVDTFCLDCPKPGDNPGGPLVDGGDFTNADGGGGSHTTIPGGDDGSVGGGKDGGGPDAMVVARPDGGCVDKEICNGVDDDCDGKVDEDTNPSDVGIDVNTDALNCSKCGNVCALPHAFNKCVDATCAIDDTQGVNGCDVGFFDLDKDVTNGCEYRCTKTSDDDALCDLVDNNCNGTIDEDVNLTTDANNCGACGYRCTFSRAAEGGTCQNGTCVLDSSKCDEGYADSDNEDANGCEYKCPVFPTTGELCNFVDDDCDHIVDEDVDTSDPQVGAKCGSPPDDPDRGACVAGHNQCQAGVLACVGAIGPEVEVCDGIDNDCDGDIDSDDPNLNLPCNVPLPGSECMAGTLRIPGGAAACAEGAVQELECFGGKGPVDETCDGFDNDCDGEVDEADANGVKPEEGQDCINGSSGVTTATKHPADWATVTGLWTAKTVCKPGLTVCIGGNLICRDEVAPEPFEQCDDVDHDCDGQTLNGFTFAGGATTTGPDPLVGDACGTETGECAFGTITCHQATATRTCDNQVLPKAELCNGLDDDCDGQIDDANPTPPSGVGEPCVINPDGSMTHGPSVTARRECLVGTTVCAAGTLACPDYVGPTAELCDNLDQDCDGVLAEASYPADVRVGASCDMDGKTLGICSTSGTQVCSNAGVGGPHIACQGEVPPAPELCDGLDNNCNGANDDGADEPWLSVPCKTLGNGSVMLNPAAALGTCTLGTAQCVGGHQTCVGEVGPALETCNVAVTPADLSKPQFDQDCDGTVDEDFQLQTNVNKCGTCTNDCTTSQPHANMVCVAGACQISSCKPGYHDSKLIAGADCSLHEGVDCTFTGQEICDGKDNDCDANIDESSVAEPMFLPTSTQYCLQLGKCATSTVACRTHKLADLDNTSCTGYGDATCKTEPVCTVRPSPEVCNSPYNMETAAAYDDDCDGVSDSVEFNLDASCTSAGVGACATPGNLACDLVSAPTTDTRCVNAMGTTVTAGSFGTETVCNNIDDDCDGNTDEACPGTLRSCVNGDVWATLPSGVQIYAYEASRRDATSGSTGVQNARACSVAGVQPWTNLTWDEANDACQAADPQGRLCTEEEWQNACAGVDGSTNTCTWSFSTYAAAGSPGCNTYATGDCNGLDWVPVGNPIEPTGWTGTPLMSSTCSRPHGSPAANVFDLSGNVKEYVEERLDNAIPVRGGAYNNTSVGISCGFDYTIWPNPDVAKFSNVGFRCCRGTAAPHCVTVNADDSLMPIVAPNGNNSQDDLTATLTVALPGSGLQITDVNVIFKGLHSDFEDVQVITLKSPDNTTITLRNADNTCATATDGFDMYIDDQGQPYASFSCTAPSGGGIPTKAQTGAAVLAGFNGKDPEGTWTLVLQDNESDSSNGNGDQVNGQNWRIQSFALKICAQ